MDYIPLDMLQQVCGIDQCHCNNSRFLFVIFDVIFTAILALIGKISLMSPVVLNVPTRASLAVETKGLLFLWLAHLNNKRNVC